MSNKATELSLKNKTAESLRVALQKEFVSRCKKNSAYSMRAFAKFLEIDQSLLSKIMRGEREISKDYTSQIGSKLGIKPSTLARQKNIADAFTPHPDDEFSMISEWYHLALLELSKTKAFKPDVQNISKRLGIHAEEARAAIERLQRLGLVRLDKGMWSLNSPNNTWTNTKSTSEAKKLLQKNLLERGISAIETIPFEMRENGSLTVAINKKRLPEFKEKLKQIRIELGEFFQTDSELDEVYQLTVSFFPLTKFDGELK